jgi:hypothetical protein
MVIHGPRVSDGIPEDRTVGSHDRQPCVDPLAQTLDERIESSESVAGFQCRRHCRGHDLCLGRQLLCQTVDVKLATGDGKVDSERRQHSNDETYLGQRQAAADGPGQERCQDLVASRSRTLSASGTRCGRGSTDRRDVHCQQYRPGVGPSRTGEAARASLHLGAPAEIQFTVLTIL